MFVLLMLLTFFIVQSLRFPLHDFGNYYFGAKLFVEGNLNASTYFPYEFNEAILNLGYQPDFLSYAPNTPFLAIVFVPFTFFAPNDAKLMINLLSVLGFLFSFYRICKFYQVKPLQCLLIVGLISYPLRNELLFGQVYLVLVILLIEFLLAYEKEKTHLTAIFLVLAIFLKVFPVLFIFMFLFKREYKLLLLTGFYAVLLLSFTLLFTGIDVWWFYFTEVLSKASKGEISTAFVDNYQSFFMFFKRIFVFDPFENQYAFFPESSLFFGLNYALKCLVLVVGFFVTKQFNSKLKVISFWILATIILSPYGSTYTFLMFVFPLIAIFKSNLSLELKWALGILTFLVCNLPLSVFQHFPFPFSYLRFLLFAMLLMILFLKSGLKTKWRLFGAVVLVVFVSASFFYSPKKENSEAVVKVDNPILTYDYKMNGENLIYFFKQGKGSEQKSIPLSVVIQKPLEITQNQVFHNGQQLTFVKSNKRKAILVNHRFLYYLSDEDRGIGFYQLRRMEIKL